MTRSLTFSVEGNVTNALFFSRSAHVIQHVHWFWSPLCASVHDSEEFTPLQPELVHLRHRVYGSILFTLSLSQMICVSGRPDSARQKLDGNCGELLRRRQGR